jgi:hypothetical protein
VQPERDARPTSGGAQLVERADAGLGRRGRLWQRTLPCPRHDGLVLAAHDHNYQRFAPRGGVTYVVHGGGGAGLYPLRSCPPFPRVRARAAHGWLYLRAEEGSLRVRAISRWGGVHDDFQIYP